MTRIGIVRPQAITPRLSKAGKADEIKMQIAEIKYKEQSGLISKEEAQVQIMALESKLEAIESGSVLENSDIQNSNFDPAVQSLDNPEPSQNNFENSNTDSQHRQEAFFTQQALNNRAFHNL